MDWMKFGIVCAIFLSLIWVFPIADITFGWKLLDSVGVLIGAYIALEYGAAKGFTRGRF